jgi:hypothetical protein
MEPIGAVSGCNILILPVDASVLRSPGGALEAVKMPFRRVCRPHLPTSGEIRRDCKFTALRVVNAAPMLIARWSKWTERMDKAGRFRHEKMTKRRTLLPVDRITQKVKQFQ